MKNTSMIVIALAAVVLGGVGVYALANKNAAMKEAETVQKSDSMVKETVVMQKDPSPMVKTEDVMMKKDEVKMGEPKDAMMEKSGKYIPFSSEVLASAASSRRVLFFYANWCPLCKPADESFTKNVSKIPADVTLIRVNYNDSDTDQAEKDLAKKYGITYQHTFVQIDAQGNEVVKWNGGQIDELLSHLK